MRLIWTFVFLAAFLAITPHATAASSKAKADVLVEDLHLNLPTAKQLKKFSDKQLGEYLKGLQNLMTELATLPEFESKYASRNSHLENIMAQLFPLAYAATRNNCIYAGYLSVRASNGLCPRPTRGTCASPNLIMCNPILYGENVCVSPGVRATSSCENNARSSENAVAYLRAHANDWTYLKNNIQEYCRVGNQAAVCALVAARVGQLSRIPGVENIVGDPSYAPVVARGVARGATPAPLGPRVYAPGTGTPAPAAPAAIPPGTHLMTPRSDANASVGKCYSEILSHGFYCRPGNPEPFIEPEVAYRAFCQADRNYLREHKSEILQRVRRLQNCVRTGNTSSNGLTASRNRDQKEIMTGSMKTLNDCFRHIEAGKTLPSAHRGTLSFQSPMVHVSFSNGGGSVTHMGVLALFLNTLGSRLCDYNLAAPGPAPAASPAPANPRTGNQ